MMCLLGSFPYPTYSAFSRSELSSVLSVCIHELDEAVHTTG